MAGRPYEQLTEDMDPVRTAALALQFPEVIVGIKTAHYDGPEWVAVERAVAAGTKAKLPVMVDFGTFRPERPFDQLVLEKLRPGDIATHMYVAIPDAPPSPCSTPRGSSSPIWPGPEPGRQVRRRPRFRELSLGPGRPRRPAGLASRHDLDRPLRPSMNPRSRICQP